MRGWVAMVVVCSLSGCDYFWHIDHVDLDSDATASADVLDPPPQLCSVPMRVLDDSFTSTAPCQGTAWDGPYSNANMTLTSGSGRLRLEPTSNNANGGCDTLSLPFTDGGVVVHVTQAIGGDSSYTSLQLNMTTDITITISDNILYFENGNADDRWAETPYLGPAEMGWFRLRPARSRSDGFIAEYSKDSMDWQLLGTHRTTVPSNAIVSIVGGVNQAAPSFSGMADFARLIVCRN